MTDKKRLSALLWIPFLTYGISYLYLAYYHEKLFLFNTIIHEGGLYSLLETIFYASHFLGHLPSLTVIALLFIGSYLCIFEKNSNRIISNKKILFYLLIFLICSFGISVSWFGWDDTRGYFLQQKQSTHRWETGGSWLLHLPSTILLFLMIPLYQYILGFVFRIQISLSGKGKYYVFAAVVLVICFTVAYSGNVIGSMVQVWSDPRYLAHSVRELATFPLTFFPIPLYFLWKNNIKGTANYSLSCLKYFLILAMFCLVGLLYQCYIPITHGIDELAQKPVFTKEGQLGITYLLTSHYFEHILDTIYFTLICLGFYSFSFESKLKIDFKYRKQ